MHTIEIPKKLKVFEEIMFVIAIAQVMNIELPNKIRLVTLGAEKIYSIASFDLEGVKEERPRNLYPRAF